MNKYFPAKRVNAFLVLMLSAVLPLLSSCGKEADPTVIKVSNTVISGTTTPGTGTTTPGTGTTTPGTGTTTPGTGTTTPGSGSYGDGTGLGNTTWEGNGVYPKSGSGAIPVGALNSFVFRINNDTTYVWPSKFFNTIINTVSPPFDATMIELTAKSSTGTNSLFLSYSSLKTGTFPVSIKINTSRYIGSEFVQKYYEVIHGKVNVITQVLGFDQSASGSFEGYIRQDNGRDSVQIIGSFNIKQ